MDTALILATGAASSCHDVVPLAAGVTAAAVSVAAGLVVTFLAARRALAHDDAAAIGNIGLEISFAELGEPQSTEKTAPEVRLLAAMEARATARFEVQQRHYADARRQSTTFFYLSVGVGIVGFVALLVGLAVGLAGHAALGTVTGLGGLLINGTAALVLSQANRAKSDAQANLSAITQAAERDENRQMALIYASRVGEVYNERNAVNGDLARLSLVANQHASAALPQHEPVDGTPGKDELEQH
jgi:hypothetical protein